MKKFVLILSISFLASAALEAKPLGIAQTDGTLTIDRQGERIISSNDSVVQVNDTLVANENRVLLNTTSRANLFMENGSELTVESNDRFRLEKGQIALGFDSAEPLTVVYENLEITIQQSVENTDTIQKISNPASAGSALLVQGLEKNNLSVMGIGETFTIRDLNLDKIIAVIPSGDLIDLIQNADGSWMPTTIEDFRATDPGLARNKTQRVIESKDRRFAFFWWPVAAAGAGAAGILYWENKSEQDDERYPRRKEESPF